MSSDIEDLEDGEIADSDASECENVMSTTSDITQLNAEFQNRPSHPPPGLTYRMINNDSSNDSSSEEEEYNTSPMKPKRCPTFPIGKKQEISHNAGFLDAAATFQKKKTSMALWNNVAVDQTMGDSIKQINTLEKDSDDEDRGVESYDWKQTVEPLTEYKQIERDTVHYGDDMFGDVDEDELKEMNEQEKTESNVDIGDIESFGMDRTQKLPAKHRLGLKLIKEDEDEFETSHDLCDIESFGTEDTYPKANRKRTIKDRLGSRTSTDDNSKANVRKTSFERLGPKHSHGNHRHLELSRKPTFEFHCKETDSSKTVAVALVDALGEPLYQIDMFDRIVTTVGVKKAIQIYCMTENIEENGGMLILNGQRRRSPGGVFIQLIKSDKDTSKEMVRHMFPFQGHIRKKKIKPRKSSEKSMETNDQNRNSADFLSKPEALLPSTKRADEAPHADELDLCANDVNIELDFPVA